MTKIVVLDDGDDFILAEEMRGLELEVKKYEIKLKRAKLEAMKLELEKISPKENVQSGIPEIRATERGELIKLAVVTCSSSQCPS